VENEEKQKRKKELERNKLQVILHLPSRALLFEGQLTLIWD